MKKILFICLFFIISLASLSYALTPVSCYDFESEDNIYDSMGHYNGTNYLSYPTKGTSGAGRWSTYENDDIILVSNISSTFSGSSKYSVVFSGWMPNDVSTTDLYGWSMYSQGTSDRFFYLRLIPGSDTGYVAED